MHLVSILMLLKSWSRALQRKKRNRSKESSRSGRQDNGCRREKKKQRPPKKEGATETKLQRQLLNQRVVIKAERARKRAGWTVETTRHLSKTRSQRHHVMVTNWNQRPQERKWTTKSRFQRRNNRPISDVVHNPAAPKLISKQCSGTAETEQNAARGSEDRYKQQGCSRTRTSTALKR